MLAPAPYPGSVYLAEAPKITDWMQAWGSIASLIISTGALVFTGLLLRHEIRIRREEETAASANQARLVFTRITETSSDGRYLQIGWEVVNFSSEPVMDVRVRASKTGRRGTAFSQWTKADEIVKVRREGSCLIPYPGYPSDFGVALEVHFVDANGLEWSRTNRERPVRRFVWVTPADDEDLLLPDIGRNPLARLVIRLIHILRAAKVRRRWRKRGMEVKIASPRFW
ncbi:hypothetical protein Pme01_38800 [Planosporangium mesophilum]|uniref:Uncharacterized protein n=1 Tax=Planosporangium mesophilum TaxID=689768 RepID=A0A8J3TD79_9ACTN|nr:hypothetical protein Pme01_38800 [Planosporangium mesophilum]